MSPSSYLKSQKMGGGGGGDFYIARKINAKSNFIFIK